MDSSPSTLVLEDLDRRLRAMQLVLRHTIFAGGLSTTLVVAAVALVFGFTLDTLWDLPSGVRVAMLAVAVVAVGYAAISRIIIPLCRPIDRRSLAALVDESHPELEERLLSTLELAESTDSDAVIGSPLMREWLFRQTASTTRSVDFSDVVDSRPAFRRACFAAAAIILLILPYVIWQDGYGNLWARFFNPWGNYARGTNLTFEVEPGDRTVPRGEDLEISATPHFRIGEPSLPREAFLAWTEDNGDTQRRLLRFDEKNGRFLAVLPQVLQGFRYRIESSGAASREYRIAVVDRPSIAGLVLDVQPPSYSGRPAERIDGAVGEIRVFERSQLSFQATFRHPVAHARWMWLDDIRRKYEGKPADTALHDSLQSSALPGIRFALEDTQPLALSDDGLTAAWDMPADREGGFEIVLLDQHGLQNRNEPSRTLRLITDAPPSIAWTDGNDHPQAKTDDVLNFGVAASDDIGLAAVELHYSVLPTRTVKGTIPAEKSLLGGNEFASSFTLDLRKLLLPEGSLVAVKARAADGRQHPGPNESWTTDRIIAISREAQPYGANQLAARHQGVRDALKSLREEALAREKEVGELRKRLKESQDKGETIDAGADMDRLAGLQDLLEQKLEQLAAQFEQDGLLAHLAPKLAEVAKEDAHPAAELTRGANQTNDSGEKTQKLDQAQNELREADQHIGQIEQKFEELAKLEKDLLELNRLADRTDRLADDVAAFEDEQQDFVNREAREGAEEQERENLESQRRELQDDQKQISQNLQDLINRRPELLEAARVDLQERLQRLADRAERLAEKEDLLAEAMNAAARENAESLQGPAAEQQKLVKQMERLAAENELEQGRRMTAPLDLAAAQEALRNLQQGDAEAAAEAQEQAAADLECLAEALARNEQLPSDPQAAAKQLLERQQAARDRMRKAAEDSQRAQERQGFQPDASEQPLKEELKDVAAEQAAIQAATARLDVPEQNAWRQKDAVNNANEALRNLLVNSPQQAAEAAQRASENLEQLANELGSPEERQRKAVEEARNLKHMQEGLANHLDHLRNQNNSGEQLASQIEQQANQQAEIARRAADLDVPAARNEQQEAVRQAAKALASIQSKNPQDAAAASQAARQALTDLERKLEDKPTSAEEVAQLQKKQQELGETARQALNDNAADDLASKVDEQRKQGETIRQLDSAVRPLVDAASRAADDAANFLDQAKNNPQLKPAAEAALERAQAAVDQLAQAMQPPAKTPAEQARKLAEQQAAASQNARAEADANQTPLTSKAAQAADEQLAKGHGLSRIPSGPAQQAKLEAAQAQQAAKETQDRVEQLARQQPSPNPAEPTAASPELAEALQNNATAQQAAAEAMNRFADRLSQPDIAESATASEQQAAQNEIAAREPGLQELQQVAEKAEQLADMQKEAREKTEPLVQGIADEGERNSQLTQARDAQNRLNGEMWQLPRSVSPSSRAQAHQHTQFAADALGWDKPERAVSEQQAAEENLRELARQARNQSELLTEAAQRESQPATGENTEGSPDAQEASAEEPSLASRAQSLATQQRALAAQRSQNGSSDQAAANEPAQPASEADNAQAVENAVAEQQRLAEDAAGLARDAAMSITGSPAAEAAQKLAEQAARVADQAAAGSFPTATQQNTDAAEQGKAVAQQLEENPVAQGGSQPELAQAARELSERMSQNAAELERLAQTPGARDAAQSQGQRNLEGETQSLSAELEKLSQNFKSNPVDRQQQSKQAAEARKRSGEASESMKQAAEQASQGNSRSAAESAQRAAEKLRQAAARSRDSNPLHEKNPENPVPNDVGSQVADAKRQLDQAGERLAQAPPQPMPGDEPGQSPGDQAGKGQQGQLANQDGDSGKQAETPGEAPGSPAAPPPTSQMLKQGAQSLRQAASQMKLRPGDQGDQQMAGQQEKPGQPQDGGRHGQNRGASESPRIVDMEAHLKNLSARNWGQLPGTLQTEILQSTRKRPDGDYARLIKLYFEEISKDQGVGEVNREEVPN